jgi:hypothetical protein
MPFRTYPILGATVLDTFRQDLGARLIAIRAMQLRSGVAICRNVPAKVAIAGAQRRFCVITASISSLKTTRLLRQSRPLPRVGIHHWNSLVSMRGF